MDSKTLKFGKYRGKFFKTVFERDPGYVKWVLNQDISSCESNFRKFQSYARERLRYVDPASNLVKTGCVTNIVNSWNFEDMIARGLLPDLYFPNVNIIHVRYKYSLIFGTFIGYLMRRMIHEVSSPGTGIVSERLICELSLELFPQFEYQDKIASYKDLTKPWNTILREIWDMAQHDQLYRHGKCTVNHVPIPTELLDSKYSLYQYMETVANSFRGKSIRYNPDLSFGAIKADAHLIADETLVQFKVVTDPAPTRDTAQCYCYKILADKHGIPIKEIKICYLLHEVVISPSIFDLTTITEQYLDFEEKN
jgi:hypothetical protein